MLLFAAAKLQSFRKEGMWLVGADDFLILASSGKPCSAMSLTLRWFPVARKKPIIYLLTLQKVCKQSPVARQKAYYESNAITKSPKGQAHQTVWQCGHLGKRAALYSRRGGCVQTGASLGRCPEPLSDPPKPVGFESGFLGTGVPNCANLCLVVGRKK